MLRVLSTTLLLVLTVGVAAGLVYVLMQHDQIPRAGQTPGFSAPGSLTSAASAPTSAGQSPSGRPPQTAAPATTTAVFLGDNYAAGVGASTATQGWTDAVARSLDLSATVVAEPGAGYAKRGDRGTTYQGLVDQVVAAHPDLVVVSGGRNDTGDAAGTLRHAAATLFARLHAELPSARLVAIAPWWGDSPHPAKLGKVDTAVRSGVTAAGGAYLDATDPLVGHPDWMADAANPNDRGYAALAESITKALRSHLP